MKRKRTIPLNHSTVLNNLPDSNVDNHVVLQRPGRYPQEDQLDHVFILNDHGYRDDYSLLDTFSILLRIVIHPEEYPQVCNQLNFVK